MRTPVRLVTTSLPPCDDREHAAGGLACRLLGRLAGVSDDSLLRVAEDACLACASSGAPTPMRLNPVLASMLDRLASKLDSQSDVGRARVAELRELARRHLAVEYAGDRDSAEPRRYRVACHFLGPPLDATATPRGPSPALACLHPDHAGVPTSRDGCHGCRDWTDRPRGSPRPLAELLPPPPRLGPAVRSWAAGVTASSRPTPTLDWTLDSLGRAGWPGAHLFADGDVRGSPRHEHLPRTVRRPAAGAWPNYYLGLGELLARSPEADAFLMVQDDVLFYDRQDVRAYLEAILWPADPPGLVSLYCSACYSRPGSGWHRLEEPWAWGALAFVFPRPVLEAFLADPDVRGHRWGGTLGDRKAGIDALIGRWAARRGIPIHYPCPSLAQHTGDISVLWPSQRAVGNRRADRFLADVEPG
ncbi:hypothetical protein OJF2_15080 [Aquisphaera giovannonii]|uniref:Uncharacterized protein n=1 Tax=Aquisphaera giovannonii TaxID=406548 RepID=A0A5B9VXF8_9BACT|nr:hypothetical protein [Aquisphaera giovannonii]QEH33013.1 hypothetical protein OJF2_15080 [Aquisphaera giovannonii]